MEFNRPLINHFRQLAEYERLSKQVYRAKAFGTVADQLTKYGSPITSSAQVANLPGVGDSSIKIIDQFLVSGQTQRLNDLKVALPEAETIKLFMTIHGIGLVHAQEFYKLGYRTIADLWYKADLDRVQRLGILWREHVNLRILRVEVELIKQRIGDLLNPYGFRWEIAGSYRRDEPISNDIDVLVEAKPGIELEQVVQILSSILPVTFSSGDNKFLGMVRLGPTYNAHRLDIVYIKPSLTPVTVPGNDDSSYYYALLYFTGSKRFGELIRQRANVLGATLNEHGMRPTASKKDSKTNWYPVGSEADIFRYLGIQYLSPRYRTNNLTELPLV